MPNFVKPLILASQSERRQNLLREAGYRFEILTPNQDVEGRLCSGCSPDQMVAEWAMLKAADVALQIRQGRTDTQHRAGTILAADTVAELNGQILGKPRDETHAEWMLKQLSGRVHRCLTGVCLWDIASQEFIQHVAVAELKMDPLEDGALAAYLATDGWVGKAGAFGYQDGPDWLHLISGLATTVIGLPVELLPGWFDELASTVARST